MAGIYFLFYISVSFDLSGNLEGTHDRVAVC